MQAPGFFVDVEHQLLQTALLFFAITDKELNVLRSNHLFQSTFGTNSDNYFKQKEPFVQAVNNQYTSTDSVNSINDQHFNKHTQQVEHIQWELTTLHNEDEEVTGYSFLGNIFVAAKQYDNRLQSGLLEKISDAVISTDVNFCIVSFNSAAEKIYHIKKEDAVGKRTDILGHQFEQTSTELAAKQVLENRTWEGEVFFIRKDDQKKINLLSTVTAICNEQNEVIGYVAVNRDITSLREVEKNLFITQQMQEDYLEAFAKGLVIQNNKGEILFCNSAAEQILGLTKSQMIGTSSVDKSWRCVREDLSPFPGEEHPAMQCLKQGKPIQDVIMGVYKPDGEVTWINVNSNPVKQANSDTVTATVTIFTDITTERNAFRSLSESENRIRMALDKTGDNAWEHNFKTGATWFSAANNHFLGYSPEELREETSEDKWWKNTHPDDKFLLLKNDEEYRNGMRESHSLEYRILHKDGTMKWVLDRGVVIEWDEEGMPVRIVGTHTDITKEKNLHLELMKQKEQKRKDIVEAVLQAQELEREQIANELHEGIAQVLSSVKLLLDAPAADATAKEEKLKLAKEKIGEMIEELKQISQNINSSTLKLLGLEQTIDDFIASVTSHSDIIIQTDFSHFKSAIPIDYPVQLTLLRILQEVIRNIIRHSEATEATVELHSSKSFVQMFIRDNGKGFLQKDGYYGLGIKNIINRAEQYNGNVEIVSAPGKGCLLQIILPVTIQ